MNESAGENDCPNEATEAPVRGRAIFSDVLEYLHSLSARKAVGALVSLTDYGDWRRREQRRAPNRTQILRTVRPVDGKPFVRENFIDLLMMHIPTDVFGRFNGEFSAVLDEVSLPTRRPRNATEFEEALTTIADSFFNAAADAADHPAGGMRTRMLIWSVVCGTHRRARDDAYSTADQTTDEAIRAAMSAKLSDELLRQHPLYTGIFFDKFGYELRPGKELTGMVDALAALLDGLLLRLGLDGDTDRWRALFATGVIAIAREFTHPKRA